MRRLVVVGAGQPAGLLQEDEEGLLSFRYRADWLDRTDAAALSNSLPLSAGACTEGAARTFFAGLLPEGPVREHAATRLGCEATDDLALLAGLGGDCAGAIQLHAPERRPPAAGGVGCRWLSEAELAACLRELPQHPLGLDETRDVRVCLAGAQDKLPVVIDHRARTGLSRGGRATTHVLKVQVDGLEDTHVNEGFCLGLARRLGLPAAGASLRRAEDVSYLAVARYDRRREGGDIVRVHQEDVCQALALPPTRKYQAEGGPGLLDCVRLIRATSRRPDADVEMLLRAVALDYLIGNNDAHGKNLSFLRDRERGVRLAPLYDLGCTEVYPGLSRGMAMRIDEEETAEEIRAEHWRRLAQAAGLSWPVLGRWLQALATRAPPAARSLAAEMEARGWGGRITAAVCDLIARRAERLAQGLAGPAPTPRAGASSEARGGAERRAQSGGRR